jgi:hypothetical protein
VGYFKQLHNDAPEVRYIAGGAQIHTHSAALKDLLTEVKNSASLLSLFE